MPSKPTSSTRPLAPSQRVYGTRGTVAKPGQKFISTPVIGRADLDFLSRRDQAPATETFEDTSRISVKQEATSVVRTANMCVFEKQKPEGVAPGSILDEFFTLVGEADGSVKKPAGSDESLIDLEEGEILELVPSEQKSPNAVDWLGSEDDNQSSTLMSALSATPPMAEAKAQADKLAIGSEGNHEEPEKKTLSAAPPMTEAKAPEGKLATGSEDKHEEPEKKTLSPQASNFVPVEASAPEHNAQTSGVVPQGSWLSHVPTAPMPSMAYVVIVPMSGVVPFALQQALEAQPGMALLTVPPSVETQAQEASTGAKRVRKPKGGLSTSKWAS